jgi:hypothetical protein
MIIHDLSSRINPAFSRKAVTGSLFPYVEEPKIFAQEMHRDFPDLPSFFNYSANFCDRDTPLVVIAKIQSHNSIVDAMGFPYNLYLCSWMQ